MSIETSNLRVNERIIPVQCSHCVSHTGVYVDRILRCVPESKVLERGFHVYKYLVSYSTQLSGNGDDAIGSHNISSITKFKSCRWCLWNLARLQSFTIV